MDLRIFDLDAGKAYDYQGHRRGYNDTVEFEIGDGLETVKSPGRIKLSAKGINSSPPNGCLSVKNLYVDSVTGKLIVEYDDGG